MHDQPRLDQVRRWLQRGQLADASREVYAWFADYQLELQLLPSRERANVVLRKRADHTIGEVWLRQI